MKLKVTQVRSTIKRMDEHKRVIEALGLGKIGKCRVHDDNPCIRGMINKVSYLLKVEPVQGE